VTASWGKSLPHSATDVVVVADAGPLIALGRLDRLPLLTRVFGQVQVPNAVIAECLARPTLPDALRIAAAIADGLLHRCDAQAIDAPGLQAGERAAIGRAVDIGAALLVDDRAARRHAAARGLIVFGYVGGFGARQARGCTA
jgi:uncharacterized protein